MEIKDFKKIARLLKEAYKEVEQEAIQQGIDLLSEEYGLLISKVREAILKKYGFTIEEYREIKEQVEGIDKAGTLARLKDTEKKVKDAVERHIPTTEEIRSISEDVAETVAKKYIKPPQIINQIVKETTVEKPTVIKETKIEKVIENVQYNEKPLREEISKLSKKIEEYKQPTLDIDKVRSEVRSEFSQQFEHHINVLGMPNFRKLAMGLQAQIDDISIDDINNIGNVVITNPQDNDALTYDLASDTWVNEPQSGSGSTNFADNETPSGTVNGSNTVFTIVATPSPSNSLKVYVNGARLKLTDDYTLSGTTITFVTAPPTNSVILCDYKY